MDTKSLRRLEGRLWGGNPECQKANKVNIMMDDWYYIISDD